MVDKIDIKNYGKGRGQKSYKGVALTPFEQKVAETINEIIDERSECCPE